MPRARMLFAALSLFALFSGVLLYLSSFHHLTQNMAKLTWLTQDVPPVDQTADVNDRPAKNEHDVSNSVTKSRDVIGATKHGDTDAGKTLKKSEKGAGNRSKSSDTLDVKPSKDSDTLDGKPSKNSGKGAGKPSKNSDTLNGKPSKNNKNIDDKKLINSDNFAGKPSKNNSDTVGGKSSRRRDNITNQATVNSSVVFKVKKTPKTEGKKVSVKPTPLACPPYNGGMLQPCKHRVGRELQHTGDNKRHLAVVACRGRVGEAMVLLKSAVVLTTQSHVVFYIFSEQDQLSFFEKELNAWPDPVLERVEYRLYAATYPPAMTTWKDKFGPCASQRLLFPWLLLEVEAVVYVDADAVLLSPLDEVWRYFSRFNSTHMLALVAEHEDPAVSWYRKNSRIPYYLPLGLNSGVVLMNLTRLRSVNFTAAIVEYEKQYRKDISWFDQDLFNIFCRFHPDRLFLMKCSANYRGDHCAGKQANPSSACSVAEAEGIEVLHGSKRAFHSIPPFKAVHHAFRDFKLGSSNLHDLLGDLKEKLNKTRTEKCGFLADILVKNIEKIVES